MSYATAATAVNAAIGDGTNRWVGFTDTAGVEVSGPGYSRNLAYIGYAQNYYEDSSVAVGFFYSDGWGATAAWSRPVQRWQIYTAASGAGTELICDTVALGSTLDYGTWVGTKFLTFEGFVQAPASTSIVRAKSAWEIGRSLVDTLFTVGATYWVALYDKDGVELTKPGYVRKSFTAAYLNYQDRNHELAGIVIPSVDWTANRAGADWGQVFTFGVLTASSGGTAPLPATNIFQANGVRLKPSDQGLSFQGQAEFRPNADLASTVSKQLTPVFGTQVAGPTLVNAKTELAGYLADVWVGVVQSDSSEPPNVSYRRTQPIWDIAGAASAYGDNYFIQVFAQYPPFLAADTWVGINGLGLWDAEVGGAPLDWYGAPAIRPASLGLGDSVGVQSPILNGLNIILEVPSVFAVDWFDTAAAAYGSLPLVAPVLTVASVGVAGGTLPMAASCVTSLDRMKFAVDGVNVGTDTSSPYTYAWTVPGGLAVTRLVSALAEVGVYGLRSDTAVVTFVGAPTCVIQPPPGGSTVVVNTAVRLAATAVYEPGVTSVQFFVNGVSVGTATQFPYSVIYTPASVGSKTVYATASTSGGNVTSPTATLTVTAAPSFQPGGWGRQI